MKYILILSILLIPFVSKSQTDLNIDSVLKSKPDFISVEGIIDSKKTTKEGLYFNSYILHLNKDQIKKFEGKKVRVIGVVTIIKGLQNTPKKLTKNGEEIIQPGRKKDTYHFVSPYITLI